MVGALITVNERIADAYIGPVDVLPGTILNFDCAQF